MLAAPDASELRVELREADEADDEYFALGRAVLTAFRADFVDDSLRDAVDAWTATIPPEWQVRVRRGLLPNPPDPTDLDVERDFVTAVSLGYPTGKAHAGFDRFVGETFWAGEWWLAMVYAIDYAVAAGVPVPGQIVDRVRAVIEAVEPFSWEDDMARGSLDTLARVTRSDQDPAHVVEHARRRFELALARAIAEHEVMRARGVITDENKGEFPTWSGIPFANWDLLAPEVRADAEAAITRVDQSHGYDTTTGRFTSPAAGPAVP